MSSIDVHPQMSVSGEYALSTGNMSLRGLLRNSLAMVTDHPVITIAVDQTYDLETLLFSLHICLDFIQ